jgi:hypothetical protein
MSDRFFRNRFGQRIGRGGHRQGEGRGGQGSGNKVGSGPGGNCLCPKYGKQVPHIAGQRCMDQVCPDCGIKMIRG